MNNRSGEKNTNVLKESMLIDGRRTEAADGRVFTVENPARRDSVIAEVPRGGAEDVDRAVRAAARAFDDWRRVPARERGRLLLRIADELDTRVEDLARLTAMETGNAIRTQSRPEANTAAELFRYFGGVASEIKGETVPFGENVLCYTRREPLGVVAGIIPWNSPLALAALKICGAVTSGNTIVLKPSVSAPLAALHMAAVCAKYLPPGVVNVVTGTAEECGTPLASHPLVRKLTFTGSTEGGQAVMRAAAERIAPATMELGGKNPQIVFPDADDDAAVEGVFLGVRFTRQGQSCTSGSRLYLHESIFDSFLDKLAKRLGRLVIGDPLDEATDMGAIINRAQFDKVCDYIQDGMRQKGAQLLIGGLPPSEGPLAAGYYVEPTVFANVRHEWRIAREEIFGPVLAAIPWRDEEEVIRMANDSLYGLAGFIWTHDIGKALRTAHAIDAGFMQVNQGLGPGIAHSYGGFKMSGIGREWSLEGMLDSFTQRKVVIVNLKY